MDEFDVGRTVRVLPSSPVRPGQEGRVAHIHKFRGDVMNVHVQFEKGTPIVSYRPSFLEVIA